MFGRNYNFRINPFTGSVETSIRYQIVWVKVGDNIIQLQEMPKFGTVEIKSLDAIPVIYLEVYSNLSVNQFMVDYNPLIDKNIIEIQERMGTGKIFLKSNDVRLIIIKYEGYGKIPLAEEKKQYYYENYSFFRDYYIFSYITFMDNYQLTSIELIENSSDIKLYNGVVNSNQFVYGNLFSGHISNTLGSGTSYPVRKFKELNWDKRAYLSVINGNYFEVYTNGNQCVVNNSYVITLNENVKYGVLVYDGNGYLYYLGQKEVDSSFICYKINIYKKEVEIKNFTYVGDNVNNLKFLNGTGVYRNGVIYAFSEHTIQYDFSLGINRKTKRINWNIPENDYKMDIPNKGIVYLFAWDLESNKAYNVKAYHSGLYFDNFFSSEEIMITTTMFSTSFSLGQGYYQYVCGASVSNKIIIPIYFGAQSIENDFFVGSYLLYINIPECLIYNSRDMEQYKKQTDLY